MTAPHRLRVEHLDQPLGLGERAPRLSWVLPDGAREQNAYRIRAAGEESDWIDSPSSVLTAWPFVPLGSAQPVRWQVQVRTDLGTSPWSVPASFETGLLETTDWNAEWIGPTESSIASAGQRPAYELRGALAIAGPVHQARLYATACGVYEVYLNGVRVGDLELTPGFTQYADHVQVQAYDVSDLIHVADNELSAVLSDGWYRGQIGITRAADQWGDRTALLVQLHVTYADGSAGVFGTDASWECRASHITRADLIDGQTEDHRRRGTGAWAPVARRSHGFDRLVWSPAPPVRRIEDVPPRSVTVVGDSHVVDFGQNINGWVRLTDLGGAGTELTLTHGEALGIDGNVTVEHLMPAVPFLPHPLPAGMVDRVTSAGIGGVFEPRHTVHGFQYVRIDGHPDAVSAADVTGVVVHSDLRRTGWFECSEQRINQLHEAATWSFRDNACDIPTDCPQRERAGWTGDWGLYVPTAAFLYDVAGFSAKWLRDVAADQWPDGTIANISPGAPGEGRTSPIAGLNGSAGWGDAVISVPWDLYRAYGDLGVVEAMWPHMVRWLDRAVRMAAEGRHRTRTGPPQPHERFLWDTGFHWGEWLEPGVEIGDFAGFVAADKSDVATAYFARSARLMSALAGALGRCDDATRYAELAADVRSAWQAEFLRPDGTVRPATQATCVRALAFDLVPASARADVVAQLVGLIRGAGTHLATGFLATPWLLPVLADNDRVDLAYELLLQDSEPSWLTMIDRGATTIWERWNGIDEDGVPHESLNHYSKGAVISFLHRYTAGIQLVDAGYRSLRIEPLIGGGLTSAAAAHESPYGRIESSWTALDGTVRLEVLIPPGTSAEVLLPGRTAERIGPGRHVLAGARQAGRA